VRANPFTRGRALWGALSLFLVSACSVGVAEKDWQLAESFERRGQYLRAIEEYSRIVNFGQRDSLAIRAQMQIAAIYDRHLRDYPRAIRAYRDAYMRASDKASRAQSRRAIAEIYGERLQNPVAAAEEYRGLYEESDKKGKELADVVFAWAEALVESGRYAEGAERYKEFRKLYPGHKDVPRSYLDEGNAWLADRRVDNAIGLFRTFISNYEGNTAYAAMVAEAYYGLGSSFEANDELVPALEAFKRSLATYPNPKVIQLKIERVEKRRKERRL